MSGPVWMPFYVGDYLRDTTNLSAIEHGAYLLLILHYWQHGGLPENDDELATIARLSNADWPRVRGRLAPFFRKGWRHRRIEKELKKAREIQKKRKDASALGVRRKRAKSRGTSNHMDNHMVDHMVDHMDNTITWGETPPLSRAASSPPPERLGTREGEVVVVRVDAPPTSPANGGGSSLNDDEEYRRLKVEAAKRALGYGP